MADFENLNINEEAQKQEELHEQQKQQEQQNQAPVQQQDLTREQRKARFKKGQALADKLKGSYVMKQHESAKMSVPWTSELHNEYQERFRDKSMMKSRESKIKNKKSRLYAKDQTASRFEALAQGEFQMRDKRAALRRGIPQDERVKLNVQDTKDLSMVASLMIKDDKQMPAKFDELVKKYAGFKTVDGKKVEMTAEEKESARFDVMTEIANELMANSELDKINLFDDKQLSENAPLLERLTALTAIFNRMLVANPGFMEALKEGKRTKKTDEQGHVLRSEVKMEDMAGGATAKLLTNQLEKLQAVSDVYRVRKLIVTNPYYRTHYNEELSMNANEKSSPEQRYLAKLLRTSFYLGKNLQRFRGQGVDVNDASARLLQPEGAYMEKLNDKICRISTDADDYIYTPEYQKVMNGDKLKFDRDSQALIQKYKEERRQRTEALLNELEHERDTLPEEAVKFDLKTVGKKKFDKAEFMISNPTTTYKLYSARNETTPQAEKLKKEINEIIRENDAVPHSIGVNSKRLGNHLGGNSIVREVDNFTGQFTEDMTEQEVLEMVEGLTYSFQKNEEARTPEEQRMAEDMYLQAYLTYTSKVHQAMKKILNTLGDNVATLHMEDWARLRTNRRFTTLISVIGAISSNMETNLPYEFLKKYSGQDVEYLKDFYMLSRAVSGITYISDGLRSALSENIGSTKSDECEAIKEEARQKRDEINAEIEQKKAEGMADDDPEIAELRKQAMEYDGQIDTPQLIVLEREMQSLEEFRKKPVSEDDDDNIYESNQETFSMNLGLSAMRELEMLKNSSYWDYGTTSEQEKRAYKNGLRSKGISDCYDENSVKQHVLDSTSDVVDSLAKLGMKAERLDVETDVVEENMTALATSLRTMGYTDEQLSAMISKQVKKREGYIARFAEDERKAKEQNKKLLDADIENNITYKEEVRLFEDLANRLNVKIVRE